MEKIRPETVIKLNKFLPREYQLPIIDALENKGYKRILAIMPRRAGKDIVAFNLAIRQALKKTCVIYYIFPTYSQAKKVIWDSITNDGERILDYIPSELIKSKNSQEMKITLINGSIIQLVGSDNYDSLVGTNAYGMIFSEYALQDPRAYQYLRPILAANNGWALFISCVSPDTLVLSEDGLCRIKNISSSREEYSDLNKKMYGLGGFHNAEQFYYGGKQKTLKIVLESGFSLECTPVHPIWNGKEWIRSGNLKVGDLIPIQYGQDVWGPGLDISDFNYKRTKNSNKFPINIDSDDFFYLLGLIQADGNYDNNKVCITNKKDPEIIEWLMSYKFKTRLDGIHHEYSSREFCALLEYLGFNHGARNKTFPEMLFSCTKSEMRSFIQGIFDGDGCSSSHPSKRGYIKFTSTCKEFINDLQVILLNFGIASSIRMEDKAPTKKVRVWSRIYNIEITGYFAHIFYRDIGFRLERKQKNWIHVPAPLSEESGNIYPIDVSRLEGYALPKNIVTNPERMTRRMIKSLNDKRPHTYLQELLSEKYFYSPIKEITPSESEVFDFVIPETHSFFSNGYLSHNTPRGKNHLWELFQIAKELPDTWFVYKLTVEDTNHISLFEIEKERHEGLMSEDLIQQEYYTSFEMGVEGSYYAKYIDQMRSSNRIGDVPWEPGIKVHTAWDIGVRDNTSIIFFQVAGQTIRIIDCYENSKEGLEHYAKVIQSKPYIYGKHIAPHDIKVKEFGSGITRLEKAKQLGIEFTVSNDVNIADGIEAVRSTLPKVWMDQNKCVPLIKALENYRQEYDAKKKIYKSQPLHDFSSHFADSMRYLCVSLPKTRDGMTPEELKRIRARALYGEDANMPAVFRNDVPPY